MKRRIRKRALGAAVLAVSAVLLLQAARGAAPGGSDATAALIGIPIGAVLLFGRAEWLED